MHFDWLLFDLDNTLLDFSTASAIALETTLLSMDVEDLDLAKQHYRQVNKEVWDSYEEGRLEVEDLPLLRAHKFLRLVQSSTWTEEEFNNTYLTRLANENHYLPGTEDCLKYLVEEDVNMAIVTNGLSQVQRTRWKVTDLRSYFHDIFIAEEIGRPKPHQFFFDVVHGKIGRPNREKVLIIGDNPISDIKGGNDYGYKTCWVDRKKDRIKPVKSDYAISDLSDLKSILQR